MRADLAKVLTDHDLTHVTIESTDEPPAQTTGGKYPQVIPYAGNGK